MVVVMGKWLLAVLLTHAADPRTELAFIDASGTTVAASFEHLPDASLRGRLIPGTRTALVVADRAPGDYGGALLRIENGRVTQLCDGLYHASTPLITSEGRIFVERGKAGPQGPELRVDDLTVEEWTSQGLRVAWRGRGYTAHLAGSSNGEILIYAPSPSGAPLLGVKDGRVRTIVKELRSPRDFHVDDDQLYLSQIADRQWTVDRVDLASGKLERLHSQAAPTAPHPFRGDVAFNDQGLRLLHGGRLGHADEMLLATWGSIGAALRPEGTLEIIDREVRQIATPANTHIQIVGFVR
jgi:hypothetical protein